MEQVNRQLLQEKSYTVLRCLSRIKSKTLQTLELFIADIDTQDIVVLNLERASQACVDMASHTISYTQLPPAPTMADAFTTLKVSGIISNDLCSRMIKATGLRNLLVHEFHRIDWTIVWQVLQKHLEDPADFTQAILAWNQKS